MKLAEFLRKQLVILEHRKYLKNGKFICALSIRKATSQNISHFYCS